MINFYDKIEDFVAGRLSAEQEQTFKAKMEAEPEFLQEVEAHQDAHDVVGMYAKIRMKEKVKSLHQKSKTTSGVFQKKNYLVAASISILMIMSGFWFAGTNFSNQALVADNFQLPTFSQRNIGNNNADEISKQVKDAYTNKDYEQAISLLSSIPQSLAYNKAQYHLGNLYLQEKHSLNAIAVFQDLIESGDTRYLEDAQWLLVIAHLQNDDVELAKLSLEQILQTPGHSLYNRALEMKKKLNSFWREIVF